MPDDTPATDEAGAAPAGFPLVLSLTALAGATDVAGLTLLKGVFVSFMSGNTTLLGAALGDGDGARAALIGGIVATFVLGAAFGAAVASRAGAAHLPAVLAAVAAVLLLAALVPAATVHAMSFAMGALNAALDRVGSVKVGVTYVTGTLVKLGQGFGRRACGEPVGWRWLEQGVPWAGILCGAAGARAGLDRAPAPTLLLLPAAASVLAAWAWWAWRRAAA